MCSCKNRFEVSGEQHILDEVDILIMTDNTIFCDKICFKYVKGKEIFSLDKGGLYDLYVKYKDSLDFLKYWDAKPFSIYHKTKKIKIIEENGVFSVCWLVLKKQRDYYCGDLQPMSELLKDSNLVRTQRVIKFFQNFENGGNEIHKILVISDKYKIHYMKYYSEDQVDEVTLIKSKGGVNHGILELIWNKDYLYFQSDSVSDPYYRVKFENDGVAYNNLSKAEYLKAKANCVECDHLDMAKLNKLDKYIEASICSSKELNSTQYDQIKIYLEKSVRDMEGGEAVPKHKRSPE